MSLIVQYWDTDNVFLSQTMNAVKSSNPLQVFNANQASIYQYQLTVNDYAEKSCSVAGTSIYQNDLFSPAMTSISSNSSGSSLYTANVN